MKELTAYEKIEEIYGNNHNRRCIDGTITGCGKCVGYCACQLHEGYLTENLRKEHNCLGKNCYHYIKREKNPVRSMPNTFASLGSWFSEMPDKIIRDARILTAELEGLAFVKAQSFQIGVCELSYVSISNEYKMNEIAKKISDYSGCEIVLKKLNYSFDCAATIIFEKDFAVCSA